MVIAEGKKSYQLYGKIRTMNVLITGGAGILGGYLIETAPSGVSITATYHTKMPNGEGFGLTALDITEEDAVDSLLKELRPMAVIHTAGAANVDFCQKNPRQGYLSNVVGTRNVIESCRKGSIRLIHISTNAVYRGDTPPYREKSPMDPVNIYGQQKKEGDSLVRNSDLDWTIIRPILMYGWSRPWSRKDFVVWVLESLKAGQQIRLVEDIFENPLAVEDCARAIWKCLEEGISGEFNLAGKDTVNRYQLGIAASEIFGLNQQLIVPVKNETFANIAPRPANTSFDVTKMESILGIKPRPLEEGLSRMKETLPGQINLLVKGRMVK